MQRKVKGGEYLCTCQKLLSNSWDSLEYHAFLILYKLLDLSRDALQWMLTVVACGSQCPSIISERRACLLPSLTRFNVLCEPDPRGYSDLTYTQQKTKLVPGTFFHMKVTCLGNILILVLPLSISLVCYFKYIIIMYFLLKISAVLT